MKETISRSKGTHETTCTNSTDENKYIYKCMRIKAKSALSKTMRKKAAVVHTEWKNNPNRILRPVRGLKIDSEEGGCM